MILATTFRRHNLLWIFLLICLHPGTLFSQEIEISEFMASNENFLADEEGDYPDWIEIHNVSGRSINLEGWYLTDNENNLTKWTFPSIDLLPDKYLLIFASGKDRIGAELHSNFKLSSSGEYIALTKPDGSSVSASTSGQYPPQNTDISYGLINGLWVYLDFATPGYANDPGSLLSPPIYSVERGIYEEAFSLTLSTALSDTDILYTLDGSQPVAGGSQTFLYTEELVIDSTLVLRAVATKAGYNPSPTATHTYIFPSTVVHQTDRPAGYPATWGTFSTIEGLAPADYGMDPEITQSPDYQDMIIPALTSLPSISLVTPKGNLFSLSTDPDTGGIYVHTDPPTGGLGAGWERAVSFEMIYPDGEAAIQVDAGLKIQGGHSRVPEKNPKHSFRVVFRDEYGPKKLNHDVFGGKAAEQFNSIILRAGFNQTWLHWAGTQREMAQYINDSWVKDTWRKMGHLSAHNRFAHLYINGLYWGLYNLSERMDKEFMAHYLKGKESEYDVIKDYAELAEGEKDAWDQMMNVALESESYWKIQGKNESGEDDPSLPNYLNMESLIDFMILNFYIGNKDWDHHNWVAVRNRVEPGKGYQFLPWDSERSFGNLNDRIVDENNNNRPSFLYAKLREQPLFWKQFMKRAHALLGEGGLLSPDSVAIGWETRSSEIELALVAESARWGDYRRDVHSYRNGNYELYTPFEHWLPEQIRLFDTYFPQRSQAVLDQLSALDLSTQTLTFETDHGMFPNPFSATATLYYEQEQAGFVQIEILDMQGRSVDVLFADYQAIGLHLLEWNPQNLAEGIYLYKIKTGKKDLLGKIVLKR